MLNTHLLAVVFTNGTLASGLAFFPLLSLR